MPKTLVLGNWKMHGDLMMCQALASAIAEAKLSVAHGICPPAAYLLPVKQSLTGSSVSLGAQTMSEHPEGAFTGDLSGPMLKDCGCDYVLVGHSERRQYHFESDEMVAAQFVTAQKAGLIPVLCVGESLPEREAGETLSIVGRQLAAVIDAAGIEAFAKAVIAYEPIWAIGTGKVASPEQAQEVHQAIRAQLAKADTAIAAETTLLYGGSVKAANAQSLFSMPDINGGLVGGASLKAEEFIAICDAVA